MAKQWDSEGIWNATVGPTETRESVLKMAEEQGITPQDFAGECVRLAIEQGADFDRDEAFCDLCKQLDVHAG